MIELTTLRDLDLDAPAQEGRPPHISGASGVVRAGNYIYVIGDDENHLAVFPADGTEPGTWRRLFSGELPLDPKERGEHKADLEALTLLPPFSLHPHGGLLGVGSGSGGGGTRDRGFFWALNEDGSLRGVPAEIDLSPVYTLLRDHIAELNVEGATVMGDSLWLLQRGNSELGNNVVAVLSLADVQESIDSDLEIDVEELHSVRPFELGMLNGVELTFSDVAPLGDGSLLFTASAEGEPDKGEEDEIKGSAVGIIQPDGSLGVVEPIETTHKVEGVEAWLNDGMVDLLMVCDGDDPDEPSPLLTGRLAIESDEGHIDHEGYQRPES
jgi:hypothetical protein